MSDFNESLFNITVIGDSYIRRHLIPVNTSSRPSMSSAKSIICMQIGDLASSLEEVQADCSLLILSLVTNFVVDTEPEANAKYRVAGVLESFKMIITAFCQARSSVHVCLGPPLYRERPQWYRRGYVQVLEAFNSCFSNSGLANLFLLPAFSGHELKRMESICRH